MSGFFPSIHHRAMGWYLFASAVLAAGMSFAAARYPGGFDWVYTVISALASRKHNPAGAAWFAGALAVAMASLWPVVTAFMRDGLPRWVAGSLRAGVVCGTLVGVERLGFQHFSSMVRKGHELIALAAFLSFYVGIIGVYIQRVQRRHASPWCAVLVLVPLLGVGLREGWLYFAQRHLGWADYDWKGTGAPFWLSFAWWQWLAAGMLWGAVGHLLLTMSKKLKVEGAAPPTGR
ncbi:MAG TPA: hypothetical protein VG734_12830 [Lacunisphaera sp.]|nr:hypothetical protein [Lacunisphaera sp.]